MSRIALSSPHMQPSKFFGSHASLDTAIALMPYITASIAAPTVPEYNVSVPRLLPWFMPVMTISGHFSIRFMPSFVQSEGVPLIA